MNELKLKDVLWSFLKAGAALFSRRDCADFNQILEVEGKRSPELRGRPLLFSWLPTLDNLRNFLLTPTAETLSFFQELRGAL